MSPTKNFYCLMKLTHDTNVYLLVNEQGYKEAVTDFSDHLKPGNVSLAFPCVVILSFDFENFSEMSPTVKKVDAEPFVQRFFNSPELMGRNNPFSLEELLNNYSGTN